MTAENRKNNRLELTEDIMFARRSLHPFCYYGGATLNYSPTGMCFQSQYEVVPGDNLCLRMIGRHLQSFTTLDELTCMAEVKWCESVGSSDKPTYRIGLHYHGDFVPPLFIP